MCADCEGLAARSRIDRDGCSCSVQEMAHANLLFLLGNPKPKTAVALFLDEKTSVASEDPGDCPRTSDEAVATDGNSSTVVVGLLDVLLVHSLFIQSSPMVSVMGKRSKR